MAEPMVIDVDEAAPTGKMSGSDKRKALKRKRGFAGGLPGLTPEEKSAKIKALKEEMKSLFNFYLELNGNKENENVEDGSLNNNNVDSAIAVLMEESWLPLSRLAVEIFEKLKGKFGSDNSGGGGLSSLASVKSRLLLIGQRVFYGISDADADLLEDDSESALWCWETRDMKLVPKSMRAVLKSRRTYRKKIQERIIAISAMIAALEKSKNHQNHQELMKAAEKLGKTLNEAEIRLLVGNSLQKNEAEGSLKEAKQEEKLLIKQLEKNKREEAKEKRRMEQELQKEKLQNEKELKRSQDEAKKEEKRREKKESEMKKQIKRHQEEAEKDQRRKEKEEAENKKKLSLQKQASLMERFLERGANPFSKNDQPPRSATDPSPKMDKEKTDSITLAMDSVLSMDTEVKVEDIWNLHLNSWHCLGNSIRSNRHMHWGIRWKPKTDLVKKLKLTANKGLAREEEMNIEKLVDGWVGSSTDSRLSPTNSDSITANGRAHVRSKQLLQFDKSHRPAFYGFRLKKSQVVSARHPFVKDPELDYEIDSDEEWEEEEPGESLSDCEKDGEEESLDEGCSRDDGDDESEDGFFVPDGYLSEDEGVEVDKLEVNHLVEETKSSPSSKEAVNQLFRQQKCLYNLTEHALRKNQPLVVLNIMHQKAALLSADNVTGAEKHEQICLQALSICAFPVGPFVQISISDDTEDQGACTSSTKTNSTTFASPPTILDSELAQIVSVIQSCSNGINKVVECLHEKFPTISKSQLRNKVREISDFVDNRWQVKKEVVVKLGLTISPEKGSGRTKSIATFFSKRCLPPSAKSINPYETSPQISQKPASSTQQQEGTAREH
ncbi:chromatin assembly factor 1 subunit FAS1 isoform X1 [Coffea arabica]|uniref:Chromatin assembly factor 1 subunit FAS1 isoform X1 n=1 Tax=Coffea arabica TaxID=13443 RepID=A0A6P6U7G5_COFAR